MIPLTSLKPGEEDIIKKVGGLAETHQRLIELGFAEGSRIRVISKLNDDFIVVIKGSRIALSKELAEKIYI